MSDRVSHELLDAEREHELAVAWIHDGNKRSRARLVAANLRLVMKIANRYRGYGCSVADLVQEGNVGLLQAVDKFDPDRGVRLSTYASWWIRAHILRYIERNTRIIRGATTADRLRLFYNLGRTKQRLAAEGQDTSTAALAEELGVREQDVIAMEILRRPVASLDAPVYSDDSSRTARVDQVADGNDSPAEQLGAAELQERLDNALGRFGERLSGRSLEMFRDRLTSQRPASLQELGRRWGITREAARRVEQRVSRPLRRFLYQELGDTITAALGGA